MRERSRLMFSVGASSAVALAGWRTRALSGRGALAAVGVGSAIFAFGGAVWATMLVTFFALSSALSSVGRTRKQTLQEVAVKGARRDLGQVTANGAVGMLLALLARTTSRHPVVSSTYAGAIAAVAGDTWSTEIGTLSRRPPRSIIGGRVVSRGVSGGVTPLGLAAALAGGAVVGTSGALAAGVSHDRAMPPARRLLVIASVAGLVGSVVDSLLGATVQRIYRCPRCEVETERTLHRCGTATIPLRGLAAVDNDVVNLLCSLTGAGVGALLGRVWRDDSGQ